MNDRHAFLRAIKDNPDDDTPRLVYADWLEEHGEPERAELIRVQIELPRLWEKSHLQRMHLRDRERYLLATCTDFLPEELVTTQCPNCIDRGPDWETGIVECRQCDCTGLVPNYDRVDFTRGILESLECPWAFWREHGDLIWERELPWKVRLTTMPLDGGYIHNQYSLAARWPGTEFE